MTPAIIQYLPVGIEQSVMSQLSHSSVYIQNVFRRIKEQISFLLLFRNMVHLFIVKGLQLKTGL